MTSPHTTTPQPTLTGRLRASAAALAAVVLVAGMTWPASAPQALECTICKFVYDVTHNHLQSTSEERLHDSVEDSCDLALPSNYARTCKHLADEHLPHFEYYVRAGTGAEASCKLLERCD